MPKPRAVYILLFRGAGGATQLTVAPLREALTGAGFENVATYINSGNAVARHAVKMAEDGRLPKVRTAYGMNCWTAK